LSVEIWNKIGCWNNGMSEQWDVGITGCRTKGCQKSGLTPKILHG